MPIEMTTDLMGPTGYWFEDGLETDTVERDREQLDGMIQEDPVMFEKRAAVAPKDTKLFGRIRERLNADGFNDHSIDLRYIFLPIWGAIPDWLRQIIGSCVASGAMRAITTRIYWEILILGQLEETLGDNLTGADNVAPFGPFHYRAGRKYAGINGRGDGSTCGGQIKGLREVGFLPCNTPGLDQYTDAFPEPQRGSTYKDWGANDRLMDKFRSHAMKLTESSRVTDPDDSFDLLENHFKPHMICSNWGFKPYKQHSDGFWIYRKSGRWAHNMTIVGTRKASDGNEYVIVWNSWGSSAHRDGDHFYIAKSHYADWLRSANCQTIGELDLADSQLEL